MSRFCAVVLALSAALVLPANAIPPPPPVAVILVAPASMEDESARLLQSIGANGAWFEMAPAPLAPDAFADCIDADEAEACVRGVLADVEQNRPPPVVLLVSAGPGSHISWRCIGIGEAPTNAERQFITFDTLDWRNAEGPSERDRQSGASCVLAAASESGW